MSAEARASSIRIALREMRDVMIRRLADQGMLYRDIAAQVGCGKSTVQVVLTKHRQTQGVEVPGWVPDYLHEDYRLIAEEDGEECAASYCRRAKRDPIFRTGPIEGGVR